MVNVWRRSNGSKNGIRTNQTKNWKEKRANGKKHNLKLI